MHAPMMPMPKAVVGVVALQETMPPSLTRSSPTEPSPLLYLLGSTNPLPHRNEEVSPSSLYFFLPFLLLFFSLSFLITTQKVLFYSLKLTILNTFD